MDLRCIIMYFCLFILLLILLGLVCFPVTTVVLVVVFGGVHFAWLGQHGPQNSDRSKSSSLEAAIIQITDIASWNLIYEIRWIFIIRCTKRHPRFNDSYNGVYNFDTIWTAFSVTAHRYCRQVTFIRILITYFLLLTQVIAFLLGFRSTTTTIFHSILAKILGHMASSCAQYQAFCLGPPASRYQKHLFTSRQHLQKKQALHFRTS